MKSCFMALLAAGCGASGTTPCVTNQDCGSGLVCEYKSSQCVAPPAGPDAGQSCAADAECPSGLSSSGTCACTKDSWSSYAQGLMQTSCAGCHGWATSLSAVKSEASLRGNIEANAMPPNQGLPVDDQQRMLRWINCGMP